ncbi:MAG: DUF6680 family protein [Terriglobia bacterium]
MTSEVAVTIAIGIFTVLAIIVGPIIALKVQRRADEARETRGRKLLIFKTLMSNRATRLNPNFVQALNMIDIEFTDKSEKEVRDAWKELQDHYSDWGAKPPQQRQGDDKADGERAGGLLAELLVKMGKTLGYDFDKVFIKKACYYSEGPGNIEAEQHALRRAVLNLFTGQGAKLPVAVFTQDFQPLSVTRASTEPASIQPSVGTVD